MAAATIARHPLPWERDFPWHQSSIGMLLSCPERFRLYFVERRPPDHRATGFAAQLGTADHAGLEAILHAANAGEDVEREQLEAVVLEAFDEAVARAQEEGADFDPEAVARALERLVGERLDRLMLIAADPRVRAIRWHGIEHKFRGRERSGGRLWQGTIDAFGVADDYVPRFAWVGKEWVDLYPGDGVLADWKTGELPPFGFVERARNVQLAIYRLAPGVNLPPARRWRTFLAAVQDVDRPKAPNDETGKRIPKKLPKAVSAAYLEATGLDEAAAIKSRAKPRDASGEPIPKWAPERINPEWEAACARPRGPLFREARIHYPAALATIRAAIAQAEAGIFPAAGAHTGQCGRCPYATTCAAPDALARASNEEDETDAPDDLD